jgi:outer membrane protein OmpA-like peptidoglycan-associated protein
MKRQPRILAGSALGLLMASAPLGAYPLQGNDLQQALSGAQPVIRIQADCPEGASAKDCAQPKKGNPRRKENQDNAAPSEEKPRQERRQQKQAEPAPAQKAAPAEQEQPRKQRQKQQQAAPAEQAAPEAEQPKPRKQRQVERKQAEPAPKKAEPQAKPAQAEKAPAQTPAEKAPVQAEKPSGKTAEPAGKKEKLREFLKKKQGGEAAPAEAEPAGKPKATEQAAPAEEAAPKPEQKPAQAEPAEKPAEAAQPPAKGEQAAEPKSKKEKLRDYLKKKQAGEEPQGEVGRGVEPQAPEAKPGQKAQPGAKTAEPAPAAKPAEGKNQQATQPELPADTKAQTLPKGEAKARPLPKNAAPLPDSAKGAGKSAPMGEQAEGPDGKPAGESRQARKPRAEQPAGKAEAVPQSDSAAQTEIKKIDKIESVEAVEGRRIDRDRWRQERRKRIEERRDRNNVQVVKEVNNRIIIKEGDNIYVDNRDINVRLERHARDSYVEELPDDFTRYTIVKDNGVRVVTIRNANGDIVRRSRIMPDNREVVLYYVPETYYDRIEGGYADAGADLPPLQLDIPADQYILDAEYAQPDDYYTYLDAPPVEPVERIYSVDEVVHSARIRDKVRRIDLDTITFDTGSAEVDEDQVNKLQALGDAINKILEQNPAETFLIEGHTDAVGSDESNLVLSDERAQAVAEALTSVFDIPAENLTTQGYGEKYLKVNTEGESRENRRVAVRRITPLVAPVASAQ